MSLIEMIPSDLLPIVVSAATSVGTTYLSSGENGPVQTLSDIWYKMGFGKWSEDVKDERYRRELIRENSQINETGELVAKELVKIPEKNLHAPRENIARPVISALPDYSSEEHTRKMFAKLLAASLDERKDHIAQQAFVEIVKNMAPIDALILKKIFDSNGSWPISEIWCQNPNNTYKVLFTNLICDISDDENYDHNASSLSNLSRLGLVAINHGSTLSKEGSYDNLKRSSIFKKYDDENNKSISNAKAIPASVLNEDQQKTRQSIIDTEIKLHEGYVSLTPFGKNFCIICLSD